MWLRPNRARACSSERGGNRPGSLAVSLVGGDRVLLSERQRDVVEAVQQPVLDLRVDLEVRATARPADLLGGEVDLRLAGVCDRVAGIRVELDRQQGDLRAIRAEDVGEARRDRGLEAVILQRPGGV